MEATIVAVTVVFLFFEHVLSAAAAFFSGGKVDVFSAVSRISKNHHPAPSLNLNHPPRHRKMNTMIALFHGHLPRPQE